MDRDKNKMKKFHIIGIIAIILWFTSIYYSLQEGPNSTTIWAITLITAIFLYVIWFITLVADIKKEDKRFDEELERECYTNMEENDNE